MEELEMKLYAHLDRWLVPADDPAVRYLRVRIVAPERQRERGRLPLNLALVIDRSGSMSGTKLEKAKEAAIFCVRNLTEADRVAIVTYDDHVRVAAPSLHLTPEVKSRLISEIRAIYTGGSTNLGGGWLTGAQEVAANSDRDGYLSRVILMSDGLANVGIVDPEELARHATELRLRGVSTTTVGIGEDFNEYLLEQMAIKGGGHFYFIESAQQIPDTLQRELGEVLSTCARRVNLRLDLPHGVRGTLMNNYENSRHDKRIEVRLDDIFSGEIRTLAFKLDVKPDSVVVTQPIWLSLEYLDVESGEMRTVSHDEISLRYASHSECRQETPNAEVMEDVALLEAALAREEALRYDAAGDYARSAATLAGAASALQAYAPASPTVAADVAALVAESETAAKGIGKMARKAMHYAQNTRLQSRKK
jgi:Ca-activated chloride channel family protein